MRYHPTVYYVGFTYYECIIERRNRIFKNMVRNMICHSTLPKSFQEEVLKTAAYILNRVPTKITIKISYKIWIEKKTNLKHLHIYGCPIETRPYRTNEKKLKSKTFNYYSMDILIDPGVTSFIIPLLNRFSRHKIFDSSEMLSLVEKIQLKILSLKRNILIFSQVSLILFRISFLKLIMIQQIKIILKSKLL